MSEPFSADEVVTICRRLQKQAGFTDWRTKNDTRHALRHRLLPVNIEGIHHLLEHRDPAIDWHITQYVQALDSASIRIQVSARSAADSAVAAARRVENFFYALWFDWSRRRTDRIYGAYRRGLDQMAAFGCWVPNLTFSSTAKEKLIGKREDDPAKIAALLTDGKPTFQGNPFIMETPDLNAVFWEPDLSGFVEVGERTVSSLLLAYEDDEDIRKWLTSEMMAEPTTDFDKTVKVYRMETDAYIYEVVAGGNYHSGDAQILDYRPNLAGRPNYSPCPGHLTSGRAVSEMFLPLVASLYPVVTNVNFTGTLIQSGALQTGRNMYQEVKQGQQAQNFLDILSRPNEDQRVITFDRARQVLPDPRDGYRWEPVAVPDQTQLIEAHRMNKELITEYGFPIALSVDAPLQGEATSGYHARQQMEAANRFLDPPLKNVAATLHEMFMLVADTTKALNVNITVVTPDIAGGKQRTVREPLTVRPTDFEDVEVSISFDALPASARHALDEAIVRKIESGLMSRSTGMGQMYEDPVAEERRIFVDQTKEFAKQAALTTLQELIAENAPAVKAELAAEVGVPLQPPPLAPQPGGPEEPGGIREARPPEGPMPDLGMPAEPPVQMQEGNVNPDLVGAMP